jgi:LysM repeat protein
MKRITISIIISFFLLIICPANLTAQTDDSQDSITLFESLNDSIDIVNTMNYFVDSLGYYMFSDESDSIDIDSPFALSEDDLPASGHYSNFDTLKIHYPKFDFSTKTDTTYLPLVNANEKYVQPVPLGVTSNFGWRRRRFHYGIDLQLKTGDTVATCFDGVVRLTKRSKSYGYVVVVRHYNGLETLYAHLSKILVQPNQIIKAGEPIGLGGNTGRSYGSHLHWETRYLGVAINPNDIYDFNKKTLNADTLSISKRTFSYMTKIHTVKKRLKNVRVHTVKKGESLAFIAKKNGTTVAKLKKLNKIKGNTVKPKQRIRVR